MTATQPDGTTEQVFLSQLPAIDRIAGVIARRNALSADEAADFIAWARGRIADNDYAILRKFAGRSSLATYLTVALSFLFRDYRNHVWGRWRPSASAMRLGPIGVRLEELVVRDGAPIREAIAVLRSAGVGESDGELARMVARLPQRPREREVTLDGVAEGVPSNAPSPLAEEDRARVSKALSVAVAALGDEDRVITRMRFWDGVSVADIARTLRLEQKGLYRRLEAIQRRLREHLAAGGITEEVARDALSGDGLW